LRIPKPASAVSYLPARFSSVWPSAVSGLSFKPAIETDFDRNLRCFAIALQEMQPEE
jgi:hypothetical protein